MNQNIDKRILVQQLEYRWNNDPRWHGIKRPYTPDDVWRLAGTHHIDYTLARRGAERLWNLLLHEPVTHVLSAFTGCQAVREVQAGLKTLYVSGRQKTGEVHPDRNRYPAGSVPNLVSRINKALLRADQINHMQGDHRVDWLVPLVADVEAGFGGLLKAFELMKTMIEKGAAAVHFEDQLRAATTRGPFDGNALIPTSEFIEKLVAARLAADILGVDTIIIARTHALSAEFLVSDADPCDVGHTTGERTSEGFLGVRSGVDPAIARGLAYAPYADLVWLEASFPNIDEAQQFAEAMHSKCPGKMLAYSCSPSFNRKRRFDIDSITSFQRDLGQLGYKFQFMTQPARDSNIRGMTSNSDLHDGDAASETAGYPAIEHQEFVGAGYFDAVMNVVTGGNAPTLALEASTDQDHFGADEPVKLVKKVS